MRHQKILTRVQVTLSEPELKQLRKFAKLPRGAVLSDLAEGLRAALLFACDALGKIPADGDGPPDQGGVDTASERAA